MPSNLASAIPDYNTYALSLDEPWTLANAPLQPIGRHTEWSYQSAALWTTADGTSFYSYDGGVSYATQLYGWPGLGNTLWHFQPNATGGVWDPIGPQPDGDFSLLGRATEALYAYGDGLGFAIGGTQSTQTNYLQPNAFDVPGLVMYNDTMQEWKNLSTACYSNTGTVNQGVAHFVPSFGPEGLLFVFGGYTKRAAGSLRLRFHVRTYGTAMAQAGSHR